jgi:hypothetical protein
MTGWRNKLIKINELLEACAVMTVLIAPMWRGTRQRAGRV